MIVVSDTTPLLTLFKIGRIDVLNKLYNSVHINLLLSLVHDKI